MTRYLPAFLLAVCLAAPGNAAAQAADTPPPAGECADGRYQIVKATEKRAWRLDTRTGEIVACEFTGTEMLCGSTETAIRRGQTSFEDYKAEKQAEQQARQEQELAVLERVLGWFKEFLAMILEHERQTDQPRTPGPTEAISQEAGQ